MSSPHHLFTRRNFHSTPTPLATPTPTPAPPQILDIFDAPTRLGYRPIPPPSYSTPPSHHKPSFMPRPRPLPRPLPPPVVFAGPAYTVASIAPRTQLQHTNGKPAVELFDGPARIRRRVALAPTQRFWLPVIVVGSAAAYGVKALLL